MGPCIVEIDRIVIREVQYQFEDNRCRNEEIIFQGSSANRRTDGQTDRRTAAEITTISPSFSKIVGIKTILGTCGLLWAGRPRIDRIVIREVQYQFEVNRCRNEEIIVKENFGWAWPMWAGCTRIDRIVIRVVQYQFEVNPGRNREIIVKGNFGWAWPMWAERPRIDCIVIREAQYQFEVNLCRNEEVNFQGSSANRRTDGQTHITTISPLFLRKTWG
ncbi:hypothetical protein DPMN_156516 [Dreissena polymorpha]|uniref:Uncharacterized protein n=1 Tax=Dreissena polymorpha TaxID=45954 RepID=A0A9D4FTQ2_DREPO|nr:hypothetical protein DPMN_156516 [Dreissena polymorpha]